MRLELRMNQVRSGKRIRSTTSIRRSNPWSNRTKRRSPVSIGSIIHIGHLVSPQSSVLTVPRGRVRPDGGVSQYCDIIWCTVVDRCVLTSEKVSNSTVFPDNGSRAAERRAPLASSSPWNIVEHGCCKGVLGPRAVLNLHLFVRRSVSSGVEMKTLPVNTFHGVSKHQSTHRPVPHQVRCTDR